MVDQASGFPLPLFLFLRVCARRPVDRQPVDHPLAPQVTQLGVSRALRQLGHLVAPCSHSKTLQGHLIDLKEADLVVAAQASCSSYRRRVGLKFSAALPHQEALRRADQPATPLAVAVAGIFYFYHETHSCFRLG